MQSFFVVDQAYSKVYNCYRRYELSEWGGGGCLTRQLHGTQPCFTISKSTISLESKQHNNYIMSVLYFEGIFDILMLYNICQCA